jgi:hypothetical protein
MTASESSDVARAAPTHTPALDARPALPVSTSGESLWDRAAERRDEIAASIETFFADRDISAWVRKSKPGEYPLFVAVDSWKPVSETEVAAIVDKSSLSITISVAPYQQAQILYEVMLRRHAKKLAAMHWELSAEELQELLAYLLEGGKKPRFFRNRVPLLKRVIPFVGRQPKNKLIKEARPRRVAAFAGAIAALARRKRRPVVQAIPKQSLRSPRREFGVDSWHVSVPCPSEQFENFRQRVYRAASASDPSIEANVEIHQNATPRGFEERERLVLSKGQATLHIHVYPFAKHAFVGWDSNLNWYKWAEGDLVSRTVRDKRRVQYETLKVDVHEPTQFDLIEADVLAETAHARIVDEIKVFLKEREVEAELDFTIIRGDRSKALQEGKVKESRSPATTVKRWIGQ